ncbi:MAG: ABC-F family ATP-binding cassette domain-containing protein [Clostridia bacterium]
MIEIALKNIKKAYGADEILKDITFDVKTKEIAGIVGENGTGKTTIFKIIANIIDSDGGLVNISTKDSVGYLEQIPIYKDGLKVIDVLNYAFEKIEALEKNIKLLEEKMNKCEGMQLDQVLKQYASVSNEFERLGGYEKEIRLNKICNGLQFTKEHLQKSFNLLSGGEKTIVLLGKTLLENHNILLLDEPTNHLDIKALAWLEEYIKEYQGTILIISHDRYFLDKVATKIIEIEDGAAKTYMGNYSSYQKQNKEEDDAQFELYKTQQKKIKAMEAAILKLKQFGEACHGDKNPFYKRAFNMERRLEKMDVIKNVRVKHKIKLSVNMEERSANNVILVENASKSFADKQILDRANMLVNYGERVALVGENGAGKTTLLRMLFGDEKIDSGKITLGSNTAYAYLEQNVMFPNNKLSVIEYFVEDIIITASEARKYLAKFLFFADDVFKEISKLSGGEKSRLRLAKMLYANNNLLILDEPTNHLDIDAIETIEEALNEYKGTIFFISHDRYFINKIATRVVELSSKVLTSYAGDFDYYKEKKDALIENTEVKSEVKKVKKTNEVYENRKQIKSKDNEIKKLENKIKKLEDNIKSIEELMSENSADYKKLDELYIDKKEMDNELEMLMELWFELN